MFAKDIMSIKPITVKMDDKLKAVKEIFDNTKIHHLLVIESSIVFGVVSDLDLYKALSPSIGSRAETLKDAATLNKQVHQIMSRNPITLNPDAHLSEVIDIFSNHSFSCIPIVNHERKPLGIITVKDIMRLLSKKPQLFT